MMLAIRIRRVGVLFLYYVRPIIYVAHHCMLVYSAPLVVYSK